MQTYARKYGTHFEVVLVVVVYDLFLIQRLGARGWGLGVYGVIVVVVRRTGRGSSMCREVAVWTHCRIVDEFEVAEIYICILGRYI